MGQKLKNKSHEGKKSKQRRSVDGVLHATPATSVSPVEPDVIEPVQESQPERTNHSQRRWLRRTLIIALPVLGATAVVWLAGNLYFARYTVAHTTVSARTSNAVLTQTIDRAVQAYQLRVSDPAGPTQTFSLKQAAVQVNIASTVTNLRQQQHTWRARLQWWRPVPATLVTQANTAALNSFIAQHITTVVQPAHDAALTINNGTVQVSDASAGKQYGLNNAAATILVQVSHLNPTPLRVHLVALQPAITKQGLASVQTKLQSVLHQHVSITVAGKATVPTTNDIANWLTLTPDAASKTVNLQINNDHVQAYLAQVAAQNSHPPHVQLSNGSTTIPGAYGATVTGTQDATATVAKQLLTAALCVAAAGGLARPAEARKGFRHP